MYDENDRDRRELKRDFKNMEKKYRVPLQFKDLIGKSIVYISDFFPWFRLLLGIELDV